MWVTNKLGYDITLSGVTLYKNSQQELSSADATALGSNEVFVAMTTAEKGLIKSTNQPTVDPQMYVRALNSVPTLNGTPSTPGGHPAVTPAEAYAIGKVENSEDSND